MGFKNLATFEHTSKNCTWDTKSAPSPTRRKRRTPSVPRSGAFAADNKLFPSLMCFLSARPTTRHGKEAVKSGSREKNRARCGTVCKRILRSRADKIPPFRAVLAVVKGKRAARENRARYGSTVFGLKPRGAPFYRFDLFVHSPPSSCLVPKRSARARTETSVNLYLLPPLSPLLPLALPRDAWGTRGPTLPRLFYPSAPFPCFPWCFPARALRRQPHTFLVPPPRPAVLPFYPCSTCRGK